MSETSDRRFGWIAGLAVFSGATVMACSMGALAVALIAVLVALF
ncbi:MAG: hypothetical protein AB7S80_02920 [Rhizobiaceae bacterium]